MFQSSLLKTCSLPLLTQPSNTGTQEENVGRLQIPVITLKRAIVLLTHTELDLSHHFLVMLPLYRGGCRTLSSGKRSTEDGDIPMLDEVWFVKIIALVVLHRQYFRIWMTPFSQAFSRNVQTSADCGVARSTIGFREERQLGQKAAKRIQHSHQLSAASTFTVLPLEVFLTISH